MGRRAWAAGAVAALTLVGGAPGPAWGAASTTTTNVTIPLGLGVVVPCAAGGAGETVELDGQEHLAFHVTLDGAGGLHVKAHSNAEDVTGAGLTSGAAYRGTDGGDNVFNTAGVQGAFEFEFEHRLQLVGNGGAPDLSLREHEHVVNADGTVTAALADIRSDCD
jgi:hypothetical protein